MARYYVNQFSVFPYHITGRITNREAFRLSLSQVWAIFNDQLWLAHHFYGFRIHAFVLMPNHFHLLASTDTGPISEPMWRIMGETSRLMNQISGRSDQNWGKRHYKCEIIGFHHFMNVYKYIYQNPVRANLSKTAEDWPFSSLHGLIGRDSIFMPLEEDTLLFNGNRLDKKNLDWINKPIIEEHLESMRKSLMRRTFKLPTPASRKLHELNSRQI